jgi:predicted DCC family thiol-disulfide oxidoreductase YuxK
MPQVYCNPILLYDGVCGLCNRAVQFVLKRDREDRFRFAALQSNFAADGLHRNGVSPQQLDTIYVLLDRGEPGERLLVRSDAAVFVLQTVGGIWQVIGALLRVLPRWLRDPGYNLIARNRYQVFGKYATCPLPQEQDRHKFLDS